MRFPLVKSRNFTSADFYRTATDVPNDQFYLTAFAHGYAQAIRDACAGHFGARFKGININSSNRHDYNDKIARAAANSHHIYRLERDGSLHCAFDMDPIGITPRELFDFMKGKFRGELGLEEDRGVVHFAPVPMENTAEVWS